MKKLLIVAFLLLIIFFIHYCSEEFLIEERAFVFNCTSDAKKCEIFGKLRRNGDCLEEEKQQYKLSEHFVDELNKGHTAYTVSSWDEFSLFKQEYISSPFFNNINNEFFTENNLGIVFIISTGASYIKNERLYNKDNKCHFSYQIWKKRHLIIEPACARDLLYLIKIKN
jgi:hypothetical protein